MFKPFAPKSFEQIDMMLKEVHYNWAKTKMAQNIASGPIDVAFF